MDLNEAIRKAGQILHEERVRPTTKYEASLSDGSPAALLTSLGRQQSLDDERQRHPRPVHESQQGFRFKGLNYELLLALFSQVLVDDRLSFISFLLSRLQPSASQQTAELPLVAEFCIRVGYKQELIRAIAESRSIHGLLQVLPHLEDTVALNFTLFSDEELEQLATVLSQVKQWAHRKTYKAVRQRGGGGAPVLNPDYDADLSVFARHAVSICEGLIEECRQARYWYLKGALQQSANLEINVDKGKVEEYLKTLGFPGPLLETLNAAEQDFHAAATPFELKASLGHLRSFLEQLHEQACKPLSAKAGLSCPKRWGKSTEMLRANGILSQQEESFATTLYTLISDEGVHPLIAEREYARLLRNMVVEYGLLFLAKLGKLGLNLH